MVNSENNIFLFNLCICEMIEKNEWINVLQLMKSIDL